MGKERHPITGRCVNRCKYGARLADGTCPKKPSAALIPGTSNKRVNAWVRKAETAGGAILATGAKGAIKAISTGLAGSGATAGEIAAAGASALFLVTVAGLTGWLLGQDALHAGETKQIRRNAADIDRLHARVALAQSLGVYDPTKPGAGLSLTQQKAITDAYNRRLALIENPLGNVS
jgi:hypothetical protein